MRHILMLSRIAGGLAIVALVVIVTAEVITRNLFGFSLLIADEYAGYLGLAITFLGIPFALDEGALLRVDAVIEKLRGRPRAALEVLFGLLSTAVAAVITWQVWRLVSRSYERGTFAPTPAETPLWIPQSVMLIGGALLTLVAVAGTLRSLRELARGTPPEPRRP